MNDILPAETPQWQRLEREVLEVLEAYGYREVRIPLVEATGLFERTIGETTDIVEKEMYTFNDRNGDSLSLRPEGTAGCVRACLQHGLIHNQAQRLWYAGPMFRHERPQKGRYRQFHQIGVEAFGMPGPDIDAEHIVMTARLWRRLGMQGMELQFNSLGSPAARAQYRAVLVRYFSAHREVLDEDSRRRLQSNPLRILDSKNPAMRALIAGAPAFGDYIDAESAAHFDGLRRLLDGAGVSYTFNPRLVRGLDYYTRTVFEWVTDRLGSQGTVCAGGRYDELVEQFGGRPTPAAGFAMGVERLVALLQADGVAHAQETTPHVYVMPLAEDCVEAAMQWAEALRDSAPGVRVLMHCGGGSVKSQMRRADQSGARWGLLIGPDERAQDTVTVKPLRGEGAQQTLPRDEAMNWLRQAVHANDIAAPAQ